MDAHDLLNENSILPELSFEDLLAFSPIKKTDSNSDSMEFESDDRRTDEDTLLNTPGPKPKAKIIMKTPTTNTTSSAAGSTSTSTIAAAALNASKLEVIPSRSASMTNLADKRTKVVGNMSGVNSSIDRIYTYKPVKIIEAPAVNTTEASTSAVAKSNMANFFTKNQKIVPTTVKHLVRVTPKSILSQATDQLKTKPTTTSLLSGSAATSVTTAAKVAPIGKTAVKTVKGQIFYINNPGGTGLPVVRLQAKSAAAIANSQTSSDTNASAATTSTSTSTVVTAKTLPVSTTASTLPTKPATVSVNANKTVTVIRTPDGKYVPLKSAITPAAAAATATTPTTTAATAATTKVLSGNKIISTSSGSYVFKSMSSATTTTTTSATTTTTSITQKTQPTTTTTTITKLLCKTNMVAKPKPTTDGTSGTATTTTTAIATTTTPSATQFTKIIPISSNATKTTNETSFPVKTFTIQRVNAAGAVKGGASTIIKIPMKPTATPTTTSLLKTTITPTTAATTTPTTNSTSPKKTVMQNVMKISAGNNPTGSSTMPGKLQAVRIPGKPGVQYVRFLPTPKVPTTKTTTTTTIAKTTPTNTNTIKTIVVSKSTGKITSQSSTTPTSNTTTLSNSKLLNSNTSSLNEATIIIKKSPKEENTANTSTAALGNVQTKVQKTVVSLPSGATKVPTPTKIVVTQAALSPSMKNQLLLRKHKIAELNADSKTDNADEPEAKKAAISKHIVVLPAKLTTGLNARAVETEPLKIQQKVSSTEQQPQQQQQLKQPIKPIKAEEIKPEVDVKLPIAAASKQHLQKANSNAPFKLSEELFGSTLAKIKEAAKADDFVDEELMERAIFSKKSKPSKSNKAVSVASDEVPPPVDTNSAVLVRRKHCNCSKSQCLKLYCDCFANGEFCQDCTCRDCCNNLKFEDERQRAIMICLERNPNAFKPKITSTDQGDASMRHKRGCNCKRSGCLKNYCECYEAKVPCTKYCKCVGCRNVDDAGDLDPLDPQAFATFKANVDKAINAANLKAGQKRGNRNDNNDEDSKRDLAVIGSNDNSDNEDPNRSSSAEKHPINFITTEVIGATVQCMLSQAEQCERTHFPTHHVEKLVIEELGRCLVEIIDFSIRNTDSSFSQD